MDKQKVIDELYKLSYWVGNYEPRMALVYAIEMLTDAEPVIRCKDCKNYWREYGLCAELTNDNVCRVHVGENDYCSKAERKKD